MSRKNQAPISLAKIANYTSKNKNKTIIIVGKVLNDERIFLIPKIFICALKISSSARERIFKAGGAVFTFDQLAMKFPTGKNCILIKGLASRKKKTKRTKKED